MTQDALPGNSLEPAWASQWLLLVERVVEKSPPGLPPTESP